MHKVIKGSWVIAAAVAAHFSASATGHAPNIGQLAEDVNPKRPNVVLAEDVNPKRPNVALVEDVNPKRPNVDLASVLA